MYVPGEGPLDAKVMLIGEAPGENEDREGRPFVGISGQELDRYLSLDARMRREDVYITNLVKVRPPDNSDPTAEMIAEHEPELMRELRTIRPEIIVTLGKHSSRWVTGHDIKMDREWGIPRRIYMCDCGKPGCIDNVWWEVTVLPLYHPAYGLYSMEEQVTLELGFERLGKMVRDPKLRIPPRDEYPEPDYREWTGADAPFTSPYDLLAVDTEGRRGSAWCMTWCSKPGTGRLARADTVRNWPEFRQDIETSRIVFFNAPWDLEILSEMGVEVKRYHDVMVMCKLLGPMYPFGLKMNSYRNCAMEMDDFVDIIAEPSRRFAVEYLTKLLEEHPCLPCKGTGGKVVTIPEHWVPAQTKTVNTKDGPKQRNFKAKLVPMKRKMEKCPECEGDKTSWPKPQAMLLWENGKAKVWQPNRIGKRVRSILTAVESGKTNKKGELVDPKARWEDADPPELREMVEEVAGEMPSATLDEVPFEVVRDYACRDADATLRNFYKLYPEIERLELTKPYETDLAIMPMVVRMMKVGMGVDREYFAGLSKQFGKEMRRCALEIERIAGYYVNPSSPKQVANLLFEHLKLPPVKLTKSKSGESTDDKVLEQLFITTKHPVTKAIMRYREVHKLKGSFSDKLPRMVGADGRIHTSLHVPGAETGRLSSSDPNMQNIPARTEDGRLIRAGFVAKPGFLFGSWDLSQIELRVMAHYSQDPAMIEAFATGQDLHKLTAMRIWNIPLEQVTSAQRTSAKNIIFGLIYGITSKGLRDQFALRGIDITEKEAQELIDTVLFDLYPGIPSFWEGKFAEARRNGYVRSESGRLRWVAAVRSRARWVREAALRQGANFPVQEYAGHILKVAMIYIWDRVLPALWRKGLEVECVLPVHDELVFEFREGLEDLLDPMVRYALTETTKLSVPVKCDSHFGVNWGELKD